MIPLVKNPGLRPTGVGKVLRIVFGKAVKVLCKKDVTKAARSFQLRAGQDVGAEEATYAMKNFHADAALLIVP